MYLAMSPVTGSPPWRVLVSLQPLGRRLFQRTRVPCVGCIRMFRILKRVAPPSGRVFRYNMAV